MLRNNGVGLWLSLLFKYYRPHHQFYGKLKYYICKNMDFVASLIKRQTLTNFFSYYLLEKEVTWKQRSKRYLIIKYANYVNRTLTMHSFSRNIGITKLKTKSQNSIIYKKMLIKLERFHEIGFRKEHAVDRINNIAQLASR